ncbi:MAG: glycosyltransferase family 1 protein [Verrucomicrobia bacterium]|nr:glycosyltransferase family 1 protein [Verrucomicrobiota bacterium]
MNRPRKLVLFRGYMEEQRNSMEVYADNLKVNLRRLDQNCIEIDEFRPRMSSLARRLPEFGNCRMRVNRYLAYPVQARRARGTLNHILDHGYAHLLQVLDPKKTVLTVHDVIPILGGMGKICGVDLGRRRWLSEWTARYYKKARRIIANSESTKNDLVKHCGCEPELITVVYLGINSSFRPVPVFKKRECRITLGLPQENVKLVLITGQQFYKNQAGSIRAMELLQRKYGSTIWLVRLGRSSAEWDLAIASSSFQHQVTYLENLPSDRMPQLYNAVDCLLFPSWYEGFGLPPVEAMASGTPVVTSSVASLPEVVGEAGLMVPPDNVVGLAEAVEALLENAGLRQAQIKKGLDHVKKFGWEKNAAMTMEIYNEVLEE